MEKHGSLGRGHSVERDKETEKDRSFEKQAGILTGSEVEGVD
jgi:hypothetical protein